MNIDNNNIFTKSSCLTYDEMTDYVSGNLSVDKIRRIEHHITDCEMCNDELEGVSYLADKEQLPKITNSLNNKIDSYFNKNEKSLPILEEKKKRFNLKRTFSIAASIALLITAGYFIYDIQNDTSSKNLAEANIPKEEFKDVQSVITNNLTKDTSNETMNEVNTSNKDNDIENIETSEKETSNKKEEATIESNTEKINISVADNEVNDVVEKEETNDVEDIIEENTPISNSNEINNKFSENKTSSKLSFGTTRGGNIERKKKVTNNYKYLKDSGLLAYNVKSYKDAIVDFNKYLEHNPNDIEITFKTGMAYFYTNKSETAILKYNKVISSKNIKYFEDAQWYKATALLNKGKKDDALPLLEQIVKDAGKYSQMAIIKISKIKN